MPERRTVSLRSTPEIALDHMERPTSALHLSRITLNLRELRAEPHTKEVGHHAVYSSDCLRSARGDDGRGGTTSRTADPGASLPDLGQSDDSAVRQAATAERGYGAVLLRGRPMRLRVAARPDGRGHPL